MTSADPPPWAITETIRGDINPDPAAFAGKPLLLLFFNLSCAGCTGRALPYTLELQERYPDLQIAAIHSSFSPGSTFSAAQVRSVLDYFGVTYPVFMDDGETTFSHYEAEGTPHWIVFDREGQVHRSFFGSMEGPVQRMEYLLLELFENG